MSVSAVAQVHIQPGSGVHLQENAGIYVQGDFTSTDNITGIGSVYMIGDSLQSVNTNGFSVPRLSINNSKGVSLAGNLDITDRLILTDGNLVLNPFMLSLNEATIIESSNEHAVVTNSSGVIRKHANRNVQDFFVPLSNGQRYTPVILSMRGRYNNGYVDVSSFAKPNSNRPVNAREYANNYWKVVSNGIDGEVNAVAFPAASSANNNLSGYLWQNGKWKASQYEGGTIRATIKGGAAEIYAMSIENNSLQPNPAVNSTTLVYYSENTGRSQLTVTDSRGRIIYGRTVSMVKGINKYNLDLGAVVKGYYDVSVIQRGKKSTLKLVKQ